MIKPVVGIIDVLISENGARILTSLGGFDSWRTDSSLIAGQLEGLVADGFRYCAVIDVIQKAEIPIKE